MRLLPLLAVLVCMSLSAEPIELNDQPFAVVELFTSEGCSSCPPADIVASDLLREARENDQSVYILAFHVDYWNRLGWIDRFSSPDYSLRQRHYTRVMGLRSSYTPQMIVNGQAEFVGSHRIKADRAVDAALEQPRQLAVGVRVEPGDHDTQLKVTWRTDRALENADLHIAIVEDALDTRVKRGENSGRHLQHDGVVRAFTTAAIDADQGTTVLAVPEDVRRDNASVIVYAQLRDDLKILGADRADVPPLQSDP